MKNLLFPAVILPFATSTLLAQDIERFQPPTVEVGPAEVEPEVQPLPEPESTEASEEVVGHIHGIVVWGNPDLVQTDSPPPAKGLEILDEDLPVPDEVRAALNSHIDTPLSLKSINTLARDTVLAYREAGLPVVDVAFPEQDVSDGVLQLVVVVGKAGDITVNGAKHFDEEIYLRSFRTESGDLILQENVLKDLRYLNRKVQFSSDSSSSSSSSDSRS